MSYLQECQIQEWPELHEGLRKKLHSGCLVGCKYDFCYSMHPVWKVGKNKINLTLKYQGN